MKLLLVGAAVLALGRQSMRNPVDFHVYHGVARQALAGDLNVYPEEIFTGTGPVSALGFRYPPVLALIFAPLGLLPLGPAALFVFVLKIATLVAIVGLVGRWLRVPRQRWWTLGLLATLATGGYLVEEFRNGNVHFLVLGAIVGVLYLVERGRVFGAGVLLALASVTKVTPIVFVAYLALRRRYRTCAVAAGAAFALLAAPVLVVGVSENARLLTGYRLAATQTLDQTGNHSLRGVLSRLIEGPRPGDVYPDIRVLVTGRRLRALVTALWLAGAAACAALLLLLFRHPAMTVEVRLLDWALLIVGVLVFAPHTQRIYFSTLFLPCIVLAGVWLREPVRRVMSPIPAVLALTTATGTVIPAVISSREMALRYEAYSPYVWTALVLLAGLVVYRDRLNREPGLSVRGVPAESAGDRVS